MKTTRRNKNARVKRHKKSAWQKAEEAPMHFKLEDFLNGYCQFISKANRYGLGYSV